MGKCECGRLKGNPCGPLRPNTINVTMPAGEMTRHQIQESLGLRHEDHFRKAYLLPALQAGLIEMTVPDKPRSRNQRYRLTPEGREFLRQTQEPQ